MEEAKFTGKDIKTGERVCGYLTVYNYIGEARGKDVKTGEWRYGYLTEYNHIGKAYNGFDIDGNETIVGDLHEVDPDTVGQYINRLDQRGQKIFTGDIVREAYTEEHSNETRSLHKKMIVITLAHFAEKSERMRTWEKIGNIHDNPELLK